LNASETGHLVMTTVHSATCAEALQRVVAAFPSEIQNSVAAQLADCLVAVIAQRLRFRPDLNVRVPECEILIPTNPVKAHIRSRDFFKIISAMETGAASGMWTFARYCAWLEKRTSWFIPPPDAEPPDSETDDMPIAAAPLPTSSSASVAQTPKPQTPGPGAAGGKRIEIEPVEGDFGKILK
jgi:twitching motility protein PilT